MKHRLRQLGRRTQRRLADLAPAVLRDPVPGLVLPRRRRRARLRPPAPPARGRAARRPLDQAPSGYSEDQRGKAGGFVGDPDVMDTWATSSLTPQIAGGWEEDPDLFERVFPMDLCTNAHDIIRTWLFSRVVRAHLENDATPWSHAMISGFIVDPDRKKMSKSKGNAIVPTDDPRQVRRRRRPLARSDGPARPGLPLRRDPDEGRSPAGDEGPQRLQVRARQRRGDAVRSRTCVTEPVDRALLGKLARALAETTRAFDAYDYTTALEQTERFFWDFCDDYVELVKERAYGDERRCRQPSPPRRAGHRAARRSCACSRPSSPTPPKRSGRGGSRARSTCRRGRPPTSWATRPQPTRPCSTPSPRCSPACAARSRPPRSACARRSSEATITGPQSALGGDPQCRARPARGRLDHR